MLHVRFAILLCKRFGDFGKKERERESLKSREGNGLDGRVLHRSILEK